MTLAMCIADLDVRVLARYSVDLGDQRVEPDLSASLELKEEVEVQTIGSLLKLPT